MLNLGLTPRTAYGMRAHGDGVGCRVTERYGTKVIRFYRWMQVFFLLQEHSKHPREVVITPQASTSSFSSSTIKRRCAVARSVFV